MEKRLRHACDERLLDGIGLWADQRTETSFQGAPALFLDRDGVLVEETHYLGRVEDMAMIPGAAEAVARMNARGVPVILVTNQAGIARDYYGWHDFNLVQEALCSALASAGAWLDLVLACAYHNVGSGALNTPNHPWRKPNGGMLTFAAERYGLDLSRSWIIGDKVSDLAAGATAGLRGGTLVRTGHGLSEVRQIESLARGATNDSFTYRVADDIGMAIGGLLNDSWV